MNARNKTWLAWLLWALSALLFIGYLVLRVATRAAMLAANTTIPLQPVEQMELSVFHFVGDIFLHMGYLAFSTLGVLILMRHSENRIGWIFCTIGFMQAVSEFATYYAIYLLAIVPGSLPGGLAAGWLQNWIIAVTTGLVFIFLPLLFPNGQLLSNRWRVIGWLGIGTTILVAFWMAFHPGPLVTTALAALSDPLKAWNNPLPITALVNLDLNIVFWMGGGLLLACMLTAATSLILRFRQSTGDERQQIKWFAYIIALLAGVYIVGVPTKLLYLSAPSTYFVAIVTERLVYVVVAFIGLPIAAGLAILKYRLYDIDLLINRTLVYGSLTASVAGLYALIVGGFGILFQTQSTLPGILITLLLITFLFQPLRRRLLNIANRFVPVTQTLLTPTQRDDEMANTILHGRWLTLVRVIWAAIALLIAGIAITAIPALLQELWLESSRPLFAFTLRKIGLSVDFYVAYNFALEILHTLGFFSVAIIIFRRKSDDWMALFTSLMLVLLAPIWSSHLPLLSVLRMAQPAWNFAFDSLEAMGLGSLALFLFLFPDGRMIPRWTRILAIWILTWPFIRPFSPSTWESDYMLSYYVYLGLFGTGLFAQFYRYKRFSGPVERQQTKWVVYGFATTVLVSFAIILPSQFMESLWGPSPAGMRYFLIINSVMVFVSLLMPISIGISILRYQLWDIDIFINRSLVYGALIINIIGLYIIMVGASGILFQSVGNTILSILATGLIAVLFQPLRERLQRGINHLMYGERDDPYAVLSRLGQRLEAAYAPESVLPTIVETVAQTLKLPYVAIALNQDGEFKIAAEFGHSKLEPITLPLIYQGEPVGELILAPRGPGERCFTAAERQLLDDLARQAGVAAHAVRLTADLQRSRERLVAAREEERRRLRRDLHDGLGPQLASLALKLEAARNRMADDPQAAALLTDLSTRTQDAVADIRRLVYALRPPALDELGLIMALREGAMQYNQQGINGLKIRFDAPEKLPPLPAAVEVAVYRIAQEALTNVVRHADARMCHVRLRLDESMGLLCLEVQDDGKGMPMERRAGVGLNSMRERAEELGGSLIVTSDSTGGTRLTAQLPCRVTEPSHRTNRKTSSIPPEEV